MSTSDSPVVTPDIATAAPAIVAQLPLRARPSAPVSFSSPRRSLSIVVALTAALVALADFLFYAVPLGWTAGLFTIALAVALTIRSDNYLRHWPGRLMLAALVGVSIALMEHPGPLRITVAALAVLSIAAMNRHGWTTSATAWLMRWTESASRVFAQLPLDIAGVNRWSRAHGGRASRSLRSVTNWIVPIALSLVFVGLFALANPVISRWLEQAGSSVSRTFSNFSEYVTVSRLGLWLAFALGTWSLLRGCVRWPGARSGVPEQAVATPLLSTSSSQFPALLVRCLILFNIVFAIQMSIDLAMVLSNGSLLPEGMDYRTYARRGAYPLVATALLAAAFVLVTFPTGRNAENAMRDSNAMRWARRLVCFWIAQNVLLTVSAMWRLWMYVEALSLTRLRIAAAIWMLLVAIGLIAIIWRIIQHRTNAWLVRVNMASLLAILLGCCFLNFDSAIVWYDVTRCAEVNGPGPHLDRLYLRSLGPEAIEPFTWLAANARKPEFKQMLASDIKALTTELHDDMASWQGWTWRRASIVAAIAR